MRGNRTKEKRKRRRRMEVKEGMCRWREERESVRRNEEDMGGEGGEESTKEERNVEERSMHTDRHTESRGVRQVRGRTQEYHE